jgi:hypothetical protein
MKDLDGRNQLLENAFGLISGYYLWNIHRMSVEAGSVWKLEDPSTIEIIVTKDNAAEMYDYCRAIRSGYSVGLKKAGMKLIKEARAKAHELLFEEANDPNTSIERKIQLVRLTSKD